MFFAGKQLTTPGVYSQVQDLPGKTGSLADAAAAAPKPVIPPPPPGSSGTLAFTAAANAVYAAAF